MPFIVTIDTDWAPDWMIEEVANLLIKYNVRATWFATHKSKIIEELEEEELFEIGIHPNCLPGSSHGETEDEVLSYMKLLFPYAISMRTHGLYQNSNFLWKAARNYGIKIDVSQFIPAATKVKPYTLYFPDSAIIRVPYEWEDDYEMFKPQPNWDNIPLDKGYPMIFDFHPVHIILNSPNIYIYRELKSINPMVSLWERKFVNYYVNNKTGVKTYFLKLLNNTKGKTIREYIYEI